MSNDKFKILVTDDDEDLRELLTEAVKNWGYVSGVACNGNDAIGKLKMEKFDIVISDLMMPGMDGLELLSKIRELDKDIVVIIITGYATIDTAVKAIEAGAYDYIAKPFRLDELMVVIKNACERLRLTSQNKTLLDDLRKAYGEITELKSNIVEDHGEKKSAEEKGEGDIASPDTPVQPKQREYINEADRRLISNKKAIH